MVLGLAAQDKMATIRVTAAAPLQVEGAVVMSEVPEGRRKGKTRGTAGHRWERVMLGYEQHELSRPALEGKRDLGQDFEGGSAIDAIFLVDMKFVNGPVPYFSSDVASGEVNCGFMCGWIFNCGFCYVIGRLVASMADVSFDPV
ncbi:hypothetical protein AVEN_87893-1 [Araneus ventricosus]|uniref:Uncharacterized protein n=1 Tax=Araneus ventricosus TaxID=182803 RepID=A0A4Y2BDW1_ARAVE|nr:hypothetical protein AVEN_87893-1 [Araneus ventricosus]